MFKCCLSALIQSHSRFATRLLHCRWYVVRTRPTNPLFRCLKSRCCCYSTQLVLSQSRPSVLWHCWLGHVTRKTFSEMTYNVSSGTLNSTIGLPYHLSQFKKTFYRSQWRIEYGLSVPKIISECSELVKLIICGIDYSGPVFWDTLLLLLLLLLNECY